MQARVHGLLVFLKPFMLVCNHAPQTALAMLIVSHVWCGRFATPKWVGDRSYHRGLPVAQQWTMNLALPTTTYSVAMVGALYMVPGFVGA